MKKGGLGKGLDSLIPKTNKENVSRETLLRIAEVEPNREQPRKNFDDVTIDELADSIKENGVIQPIIVVKGDGYYKIVAGERRWRAAKKAGLTKIPALIKDYSEEKISEIALIENMQRENLNSVDEAFGIKTLIDKYELKQEEVAKVLSKSRPYITNALRLLSLSKDVLELLKDGKLSTGHARALLAVKDEEKQLHLAHLVIEKGLSVRQVEELVNGKSIEPKIKQYKTQEVLKLEKELETLLKTKITIKNSSKNKGNIKIQYNNLEEFERIVDLFRRW